MDAYCCRYLFGKLESVKTQLNQEDRKCMVPKRLQVQETIRRYQQIDGIITQTISKNLSSRNFSPKKLDKILVHPVLGYLVLGLFYSPFSKVYFSSQNIL